MEEPKKIPLVASTSPAVLTTGSTGFLGLFCVFCPETKQLTEPLRSEAEANEIAQGLRKETGKATLVLSVVSQF